LKQQRSQVVSEDGLRRGWATTCDVSHEEAAAIAESINLEQAVASTVGEDSINLDGMAPAVAKVQSRLRRHLKRPSLKQGSPKAQQEAGLLARRNAVAWNLVEEPQMETGSTSSVNMLKEEDNLINSTQGMLQNTAARYNLKQDRDATNSPQGPLQDSTSWSDPQGLQSPRQQQGEQLQQHHEHQQRKSQQLQQTQLHGRQWEEYPMPKQRASPRQTFEHFIQKPLEVEGEERSEEERSDAGLPNFWTSEPDFSPDADRWPSPSDQSRPQSPMHAAGAPRTVDSHKAAKLAEERPWVGVGSPASSQVPSRKTTVNNLRNAKVQAEVSKVQDTAKDQKSARLKARLTKLQAENFQLDTQISECEIRIQKIRTDAPPAQISRLAHTPTVGDIKRKIQLHSKALQKLMEKCVAMQAFLGLVKRQSAEVNVSDALPFSEDWKVVQQPVLRQASKRVTTPLLTLRVQSMKKLCGTASRSMFQSQSKGAQVFLQVLQERQPRQTMDGIGPVVARSEPGVAVVSSP